MMSLVEDKEVRDWSELPNHLLDLIMDGLVHSMTDYIRFGTVCVSWRTAYNIHNPRLLPLLIVPSTFSTFTSSSSENNFHGAKKKKNKKELRRFYNVLNQKLDDRVKAIKMPHYRQCRGSSHGWLITVDDVEFPVRLFNPFLSPSLSCSSSFGNSKGVDILLPSLDSFPIKTSILHKIGYSFLRKAVLSANPISNPTDYRVMIIYGGGGGDSKLAFLKSGDKDWTTITFPKIKNSFQDIICYQGKFLAIDCWGTIVVCDDTTQGMAARVLLQPLEKEHTPQGMASKVLLQPLKKECNLVKYYLVESSGGNLLQVHRRLRMGKPQGRLMYTTVGFKIYKLLLKRHQLTTNVQGITAEEDYEWVEMKSFGGDTVFLGDNASISIPARNYPGCKSDCIYYTDDHFGFYIDCPQDGPQDMGVFNLEEGSIERYYSTDFNDSSVRPIPIWPVPIWIQPSLQKRRN